MRHRIEEQTLIAPDGVALHVRHFGQAGPAVVVLHGIMGHGPEWDTMTERLADEARVTTVDQRGHGRSEWADDYSLTTLARDAVAVIERLHTEPVILIGHSMGGMVAMQMAGDRPDLVVGLGVIDMVPDAITPDAGEGLAGFMAMLADARHPSIEAAMEPWLEGNPYIRHDLLRHYVEHATIVEGGMVRWRFDGRGLGQFPTTGVSAKSLWDAVRRIEAPTLLVRGAHSPFVTADNARRFLDVLDNATEVVIPDAAHDLGVEAPEAVAEAMLGLIRSRVPQASSR